MSVDRILLTNDDGIDAVGLHAMYETLAETYDVTVVAPAEDRSSIGRAISGDVGVIDHELGYAIEGTPVDCVVAGLGTLVPDVDMVVAGCNKGANLGGYVLGRSGTVSAAVEASFFGMPAIAASLFVPGDSDDWRKQKLSSVRFDHATSATRFLVDEAIASGVFDGVDYLNVNAPLAEEEPEGGTAPMRATTPSTWYGMDAERDGDEIRFHDRIWERMTPEEVPDPVGTDRRAVVDGEISVSALTAPHDAAPDEALDGLVERYES